MKKLLLCVFLVSCKTAPPIKEYHITTFKESGEISEVFKTKTIDKSMGSVTFPYGNGTKTVSGSYQIEGF